VHATNEDGLSWGAAAIRNTGGTVLSINLIQIRGINVPFSNWYADLDVDANLSTQELKHIGWVGGELNKTSSACGNNRIAINNGAGDICAMSHLH
jgi:hypothetical protein